LAWARAINPGDLSMRPALLMLAALAAPALAGPREGTTVLMPVNEEMRKSWEEWGFAEAVVRGDTVYLSGVVAGLRAGETDAAAAYDRAFRTIGSILERAGSSWDDVLDITSYHTDVTTGFDAFRTVKDRYVKAPFPTWTAIDVDRLIPDNGLVEIKVIAQKKR
jgi:enamine deaminase RidA (YjgF/YER057c/UK114 family)